MGCLKIRDGWMLNECTTSRIALLFPLRGLGGLVFYYLRRASQRTGVLALCKPMKIW
jgi:hypothetical protein